MSADEQDPLLPKSSADASAQGAWPASRFESVRASVSGSLGRFKAGVSGSVPAAPVFKPTFDTDSAGKVVLYEHQSLLTVKAFLSIGSSVFVQRPVWSCLLYVIVLATCSATAMFYVPSAKSFDTTRFQGFCTFLKVFISFMIGIYVQHSFARWWNTVTCFEDFLIAIKQLVFMLHSFKIHPETKDLIERYSVASCYILCAELQSAQHVSRHDSPSGSGSLTQREKHPIPFVLDWLHEHNYINADEKKNLLTKEKNGLLQVSRTMWSWIGEILTNVTKDDGSSLVPPMFIKVLSLCQVCIGKIEHVKRNVTVQTPFMYAHLLAMLVHMHNTILAVFGGLVLGSALHEMVDRGTALHTEERPSGHLVRNLYGAIQVTAGQMLVMIVEPMLYVGFLHIAHMLCYPFGTERFNLPTDAFVAKLQVELNGMSDSRKFYRSTFASLALVHAPPAHDKHDDLDEGDDEAGGDDDGGD